MPLVSPGTWDLLERLRPHLDVTVDLFDTKLAHSSVAELDGLPPEVLTLLESARTRYLHRRRFS